MRETAVKAMFELGWMTHSYFFCVLASVCFIDIRLVPPGYGLCFLFMATTPVLRSKLSKLVEPTEQGQSQIVFKYLRIDCFIWN